MHFGNVVRQPNGRRLEGMMTYTQRIQSEDVVDVALRLRLWRPPMCQSVPQAPMRVTSNGRTVLLRREADLPACVEQLRAGQ